MVDEQAMDGAALMRAYLAHSPFAQHLGMAVERLEPDAAELRLPFTPSLATAGDVVHGGAIATLADTAATAAAWTGADVSAGPRGATASFAMTYLSAARGEDLLASARVVRRGRTLCFCEVGVRTAGDAEVAQALVTYRLG